MRRHAKATTAGSTKRLGKSKPALLLCVLAASVAVLALVVGSASGATTRFLVETFGSSAQPAFPADRGMAYDQGSEELYVIDSTENTLRRFNADGSASNFSALGSNAIDGAGAEDETPQEGLSFSSNDEREQIAIDESGEATDGNLYLTQSGSDVVDIFSPAGEYLGQLSESTEGGEFGEPCGVAVDGEGTVYVGDRGDDLIHVFDPAAAVPVNGDSAAESIATLSNPCSLAAGAAATEGFLFANQSSGSAHKLDATTGEVKYEIASSVNTLSVDPGNGHVFLARNCCSSSEVAEYDASGAAEASLVSSFKPGSSVEGVAVDSASNQVFVARGSTEEVEVFGAPAIVPDVVTEAPSSSTGVRATLAGTVNPDGIELDECFFEWGLQDPTVTYENVTPCVETPAEIGAGTTPVAVHADIDGLQPDEFYQQRLVAVNPNARINGSNKNFTTPNIVFTEVASGVTPTAATLNGTVNPDGTQIDECFFEWGQQKGPLEDVQTLPEAAPCIPNPGSGTSPVAVSAEISDLHPGTTYAYRLKGVNVNGPIVNSFEFNPDDAKTLQTLGPVIADSWAEDVGITEGTLKAAINPEGDATTYRFEYGKTAAYGSQTPELEVGSDSSTHEVTRFLAGLEPGTTYHFRVVATNSTDVNEGPDRVIRTFVPPTTETDCPNQDRRIGPGASLPDCRAYEMVSPLDKNSGDIENLGAAEGTAVQARLEQSTPTAGKLTYSSYRAFAGALSAPWTSQYIAQRRVDGWDTHAINEPREEIIGPSVVTYSYRAFSTDLCYGWMRNFNEPVLGPGGLSGLVNLYRRSDRLCGVERFEAVGPIVPVSSPGTLAFITIQGISSDGKHTIFTSKRKLAPEGTDGQTQLYESTSPGAPPRLVCVLPNGEPHTGSAGCTAGFSPFLSNDRVPRLRGAISEDGERIFWADSTGAGRLYVRIGGSETLSVSQAAEIAEGFEASSQFWAAAHDGSRAIFQVKGEEFGKVNLYAFEPNGETTEKIAAGVSGVVDVSDDARRVYFVSSEALDGAAIAGRRNLYLHEAGSGGGSITFIATLTSRDVHSTQFAAVSPNAHRKAARVTPDGLRLAFTSFAPLTGYDNLITTSGKPSPQAFLYDAATGELVCASCSPSGARVPDAGDSTNGSEDSVVPLPENSLYAKRALSADGTRLFFNARSPLTPKDTNNRVDVYQWEAEGAGRCDTGDSTYAPSARGCITLLSTGTNNADSRFVDASVDGDDVFINTGSSLVPQDYGLRDIYDAKVGGGFPQPPDVPECVGDACQDIPPAPNDPTPASAGFRGAGDPVLGRSCGAAAKRAVRLSRRAKRLRRTAKRNAKPKRSKVLRGRSARSAKQARRLSRSAKRCRRANRRANR